MSLNYSNLIENLRYMRKIIYLALVFGLIFLGYRFFAPKKVDVVRASRGPAVKAIYATGTVETSEMLPIAPRTSGRIKELLADEGSRVKEGEVLAKLESDESDAMLSQLKSRVDISKREFDRQQNLLKGGATTRELYERARSELDVSEGALQAEVARRDYLLLKAPKDGVILRRDGELGQYIPSNETIFWFSSNNPTRISAEVDEEDISQVKVGQKVLIRSDAFKDEVFEGKIASITPKGDPVARSYRVRIGLNGETPLLIGMTAENNIIIREESNALLAPTSGLVKGYMWIAKNSFLEKRKVEVGAKGPDQAEILSGLNDGEEVLVNPLPQFKEGQRVKVNIVEMNSIQNKDKE